MRYLFPILFAIAVFATPIAADAAKPFNEMTLEELQAVNTKALDKAAKREHKKALKAATQALKAARKAEKDRLKAEANRRKEQEKERAKIQKAALKRLKYIDKIRSRTQISKDDFAASVEVRGADASFSHSDYSFMFTLSGSVPFFMRSFYYPGENKVVTQAYIMMQTDHIIEQEAMAWAERDPVGYANRRGIWKSYRRASLRGGKDIELTPITRRAEFSFGIGKFYEYVAVTIDLADIEAAVRESRNLDFKLYSQSARDVIFSIPHDYLVGYGMRLGEINSQINIDRALFAAPYTALSQTAGR